MNREEYEDVMAAAQMETPDPPEGNWCPAYVPSFSEHTCEGEAYVLFDRQTRDVQRKKDGRVRVVCQEAVRSIRHCPEQRGEHTCDKPVELEDQEMSARVASWRALTLVVPLHATWEDFQRLESESAFVVH